jgi:hypothetical protein
VMVCGFSKYVELFPMKSPDANKIIDRIWQTCCRHGVFRTLVSDNGTQFTSKKYQEWCEAIGISTFFISAYHAQANMTERYNRTIKTMMVSYIERCKDWDSNLHEIAFAQRTAVNDSTQFTPAYLVNGRELRCPIDNLINTPVLNRELETLKERMALVHELARENIRFSQEVSLRSYVNKSKFREFKVGDEVMNKTHFLSNASKGFSAKLAPRYDGPYRITDKVSSNVYDIVNITTGQVIKKVHINDLTPFIITE